MTEQQLNDHERRIATMEGIIPGMAADVKEIKDLLKDGKGASCAEHSAYIRSQWFHIRALWGVIGTIFTLTSSVLFFIAGKIKH